MAQEEIANEAPHRDAVLALLRTKGLSIKNLDEDKKVQVREFLEYLHHSKGVSLSDIAKMIGNKTSGYTSWLCKQVGVEARPFEEARLKGIKEKRRKYERKPFDGTDEDKAYLLGLRHGDLYVYKPWNDVVRVSTSTTRPAMTKLFRRLFEPYGHVYEDPRYKKDTKTYEWNLYAILDDSFNFLLEPWSSISSWILSRRSLMLAYLAGLFDAEGSVGIYPAKRLTSLNVAYYNTNYSLMQFVFASIQTLGLRPLPPYLDKKKGFRSPGYKIEMKKDYWRVLICRFEECQAFLRMLPIRHDEKIAKRRIGLEVASGDLWSIHKPKVQKFRAEVKSGRDEYVAEAKRRVEERLQQKSTALKSKAV